MPKRKKNAKETESQPATSEDDDARVQPATDAPVPEPQPEPEQDQATAQAERDRDFMAALGKARRLANEGDPKAKHAIRECLRNSPRIRDKLGDIAGHAEAAFAEMVSGGDFMIGEAVRQKADELRLAYCGSNPSPLEEMAVQRLVACWQNLQYTEMLKSQRKEADLAVAKYWLKRVAQAHDLYAAAEKSLLLIRKLLPSPRPSDAIIDDRLPLPAAAPPALTDDRTTADTEAGRLCEELIAPEFYQRPMNGHCHRLAGLLANAGPTPDS